MNKIGRQKLYMSVGLSILLVLQMIVFLMIKQDQSYVISIMFTLIVLLSLVAVAINYNRLRILNKRIENLNEDYRKMYVDAQEVIGLSAISKDMKLMINQAVLEIFEHATLDNRSVDEVVSPNLKTFIDGFMVETKGNYTFGYLFSYSMVLFIGYLLLMKLYKILKIGIHLESIESAQLDVGIVVSYALIAFIFFPWLMVIMKKAAMNQWQGNKRILVLLPFILPLGIMFVLIGLDSPDMRVVLDQSVPLLNHPLKLIIAVVVLVFSIWQLKHISKKD